MNSLSITELRGNLKEVLELASKGMAYEITQHGKVLAVIQAPTTHADDLQERLAKLRAGSEILGDIVNAPMADEDLEDRHDYNIAAEPKVPYGNS